MSEQKSTDISSNSETTFSPKATTTQMENFANYGTTRIIRKREEKEKCAKEFLKWMNSANKRLKFTETELVHAMYYINKTASKPDIKAEPNKFIILAAALLAAHKVLGDSSGDKHQVTSFANLFGIRPPRKLLEWDGLMWENLGFDCNISENDYKTFERILKK